MQHADHFTRILNERESFRRDKVSETNSQNNSQINEENIEKPEKNSQKNLGNLSNDENEIEKGSKLQTEIN